MTEQRKTTYVDSGLLIAVAQGRDEVYEAALSVLDDPERDFVSSVYVKLEVLPMATWLGQEDQVESYQEYFDSVSHWAPSSPELSNKALDLAREHGLGAVDALHVAAAEAKGAELVTTERPTQPMFRVTTLSVTSIHG